MQHHIFRFIPLIDIDMNNPGGEALVMYDDVSERVVVFDEYYNPIMPKTQRFEDVGAQYIAAGFYFTKKNSYPFAKRGEPVPPPEPEEPVVVEGCTDPAAFNYNPSATADDGTCEYAPVVVYGCTDPYATNYNAGATRDDGTCEYIPATFLCQTVEVRPCEPKGVYLRWFNNLGGVDSWYFTGQSDTLNAAEALGEFSEYSGLAGAAVKTADRGTLVRATRLTLNQWQALTGIFTARLVWQHHEDSRTERVYVKPASATYARNQKELEVEFSRVPFNTLTR
ncbi:hypothetical protein GCM10023188_25810 [Pontibacter saemangeumensis]|uniref:Uncharacterized protein n=1 Tax=Pontibacter saemangeumensis TaxID=1084525 RepID=A0ABP8LR72_9BACT